MQSKAPPSAPSPNGFQQQHTGKVCLKQRMYTEKNVKMQTAAERRLAEILFSLLHLRLRKLNAQGQSLGIKCWYKGSEAQLWCQDVI